MQTLIHNDPGTVRNQGNKSSTKCREKKDFEIKEKKKKCPSQINKCTLLIRI